jgi:hypothetical protein
VTLAAALALSAATAEAAPAPLRLPELVLPAPSHHVHRAAVERRKHDPIQDLGDYNLPGERSGESSTARLDANGAILL